MITCKEHVQAKLLLLADNMAGLLYKIRRTTVAFQLIFDHRQVEYELTQSLNVKNIYYCLLSIYIPFVTFKSITFLNQILTLILACVWITSSCCTSLNGYGRDIVSSLHLTTYYLYNSLEYYRILRYKYLSRGLDTYFFCQIQRLHN